jgi:Tol biopolymer transport system component
VKLNDPIYVGLGVCAHDNSRLEKARFTEVSLTRKAQTSNVATRLHSALETVPITSGDRRVVFQTSEHIEAPNWSPDGSYLLYNSSGRIYKLASAGSTPTQLDTGFARRGHYRAAVIPCPR